MGYSLNASADNCYEGTTCLINKLDIRDEKLLAETEADITFMKSVMLDNNPIEGCFDFEHYKAIHRFLFSDIYDWAGEVRTVNISKKVTAFAEADSIERIATACFKRITSGDLEDLPHNEFAAEIADLYDTINRLHPFREGNGRTQRIFFTDLIREYGYDIQFTEDNIDFLMIATIQTAQGVLDYLIQFFTDEIVEPEEKQALE